MKFRILDNNGLYKNPNDIDGVQSIYVQSCAVRRNFCYTAKGVLLHQQVKLIDTNNNTNFSVGKYFKVIINFIILVIHTPESLFNDVNEQNVKNCFREIDGHCHLW